MCGLLGRRGSTDQPINGPTDQPINRSTEQPNEKVALAYSGGLDTSIIIPWLKENYPGCEVVAICGDVGQGGDELTGLEEKALKSGALECHVADLREEFVSDYVWPMLRAGAVYETKYLLGTSIARPLLAKKQVEVALATGCDALSHGATGKGNDQVRFELTYKALAPHLPVIAPWREWDIVSREDAIDYAAKHNIPIQQSKAKIYSRDRNLVAHLARRRRAEDPANAPSDGVWMLSVDPRTRPPSRPTSRSALSRARPCRWTASGCPRLRSSSASPRSAARTASVALIWWKTASSA